MIDKILTKDKIQAEDVHQILKQYMLADGFEFVPDLKNSHGIYLVDEKTGDSYIDFFTFFASSPLGLNHPKYTPLIKTAGLWFSILITAVFAAMPLAVFFSLVK